MEINLCRLIRVDSNEIVAVCQKAHAEEDLHKEKRKRAAKSDSTCQGDCPRTHRMVQLESGVAQDNGLLNSGIQAACGKDNLEFHSLSENAETRTVSSSLSSRSSNPK
ncbi:hypothetical protein ACFE04_019247 [Oxalis oulophora]